MEPNGTPPLEPTRKSVWIDSHPGRAFPALLADIRVDVAIVGAGITGLTAGLLLKRAGLKVAVIDSLKVGRGNSGFTTAHLTAALDTRLHRLIEDFGEDGAALAVDSQRAAIDRIALFVEEEG